MIPKVKQFCYYEFERFFARPFFKSIYFNIELRRIIKCIDNTPFRQQARSVKFSLLDLD